jgi:hypothetical protein
MWSGSCYPGSEKLKGNGGKLGPVTRGPRSCAANLECIRCAMLGFLCNISSAVEDVLLSKTTYGSKKCGHGIDVLMQ